MMNILALIYYFRALSVCLSMSDQTQLKQEQALARKEKSSVFCMNWEIKCSWVSGHTVTLSVGSRGAREQSS